MHSIYGVLLKVISYELVMEACGKKKSRKKHEDTWWWNEEVKKAMQQKKVPYKEMCKNRSKENKSRYKNIKN